MLKIDDYRPKTGFKNHPDNSVIKPFRIHLQNRNLGIAMLSQERSDGEGGQRQLFNILRPETVFFGVSEEVVAIQTGNALYGRRPRNSRPDPKKRHLAVDLGDDNTLATNSRAVSVRCLQPLEHVRKGFDQQSGQVVPANRGENGVSPLPVVRPHLENKRLRNRESQSLHQHRQDRERVVKLFRFPHDVQAK